MQIHELNRPRRIDEGWMDVVKGVGKAAATGLGHSIAAGAGYDLSKNSPTASAGILDPAQKLAAVKKEPAMVELATKYADEWLKKQAQVVPEAEAVTTYDKKTGRRTLDGKSQFDLSDLPPNVQQQIQAKDLEQQTGRPNPFMTPAAQQPAAPTQTTAPAKTTGTAMPLKPFQVPGAGTNPNATPPPTPSPNATTSAATAVTNPAKAKYLKDFLEFANEKIAMRDPTTYKMIGLTSLYTANQKYSLKTELDTAKQAVIKAQGDPVATKEAVKNYILTALAAAQLMASGNKLAAATPQTPALGRQTPAPGKAGTVATTTTPTTSATGQPTGSNAVALITQAGLPAATLAKAGQAIQTATGNKQLSTSGDSVIDTMLEGMGYTVS
jgi:hypothetical protein